MVMSSTEVHSLPTGTHFIPIHQWGQPMAPISESIVDEKYVTAIILAEVRNITERNDFDRLVESIARHGSVRPLADGLITAYIVRLPLIVAPLLTATHVTLSNQYVFGQVIVPVQETALGALNDLAQDSGGEFYPVEYCSLCAKLAPFAVTVRLRGEDGKRAESESLYCPACAAGIADSPTEPAAEAADAAGETVTARK